tara:strand:+ start:496 stop:819 length:324 start_codon:yes stop_codon:yes gene_type:complete
MTLLEKIRSASPRAIMTWLNAKSLYKNTKKQKHKNTKTQKPGRGKTEIHTDEEIIQYLKDNIALQKEIQADLNILTDFINQSKQTPPPIYRFGKIRNLFSKEKNVIN